MLTIILMLMGSMLYLITRMLIDFAEDDLDTKIKKANEAVDLIMNKPLKISFERFKSLYTMNPKAWNIESESIVTYNYDTKETQWSPMLNDYKEYTVSKYPNSKY